MTEIILMGICGVVLSLVLGSIRITMHQSEWWIIFAITTCTFLIGRFYGSL